MSFLEKKYLLLILFLTVPLGTGLFLYKRDLPKRDTIKKGGASFPGGESCGADTIPLNLAQALRAAAGRESLQAQGWLGNLRRVFMPCEDEAFLCSLPGDTIYGIIAETQLASCGYEQGPPSFYCKIRQSILSTHLEEGLSPDEVLCFYLNHLSFEHRGQGVAQAAQSYFHKDFRELSLAEAAALAAFSMSPSLLDPISNPGAYGWQNDILDKMTDFGFISPQEAEAAMEGTATTITYY